MAYSMNILGKKAIKGLVPPGQPLNDIAGTSAIQGLQNVPVVSTPAPSSLGPGMTANMPLQLASLQDARAGELEDRVANDPADARSRALLGLVHSDMSNDPFTGDAARANTMGIEQRRQSAIEQGYSGSDPIQEANAAARAQEQYKVDAPVRAQEAAGKLDIERQRVANQGTKDVADSKAAQAQNFLEMLQQMPQGGGGMSGVTVPNGGGHVSFARPSTVPSALASEVTKARMAYEQAKQKGDAGSIQVAQTTLNQSVQNALAREPASSDVKDFVTHMMLNPQYNSKSLDDVINETQQSDITQDEHDQIQELLNRYRGF